MRRIDEKHSVDGDKIVKTKTLEVIEESEPTILFRARDRLALPMLRYYKALCEEDGATEYQLKSVDTMIERFQKFGEENATKQPGITRGEAWDGTPS
jgi:hypothetical protein